LFSVHGLRMNEIEGHGASGDLQGSGESAMMTPWEVQRAMKFQEGLRVGRGWAEIGVLSRGREGDLRFEI
jgi:hypothetical protein